MPDTSLPTFSTTSTVPTNVSASSPIAAPSVAQQKNGADILAIARAHVGEIYQLGAAVDYRNPNAKGPWDCAEFVSWCVYQSYGFFYGCREAPGSAYTGLWQEDAKSKGICIPVEQAIMTPGAILLRYPPTIPGTHKYGHIVISQGDGKTIEAKDHLSGVVIGNALDPMRRWDMGILLPGVVYQNSHSTGVLRRQDLPNRDPKVMALQLALKQAGFDPGPIDGLFGETTEATVLSFQCAKGLVPDGDVGPQTEQALNSVTNAPVPAQLVQGQNNGAPTISPAPTAPALSVPTVPIKSHKLADLAEEYKALYNSILFDQNRIAEIDKVANKIAAGKDRYTGIANHFSGMPWYLVGGIHLLESNCNFNRHLHNGDLLTDRTIHVPAGYPKTGNPPFTFEYSAIDALSLQGFDTVTNWTAENVLYHIECYNGLGYRGYGVFTPYLWACSQHYTKGLYYGDHNWQADMVSKQVGVAVAFKRLEEQGILKLRFS